MILFRQSSINPEQWVDPLPDLEKVVGINTAITPPGSRDSVAIQNVC